MLRFVRPFSMLLMLAMLLAGFPTPSRAETAADIVLDFAPIEGQVLLPIEGEYLVDLDASRRLGVGDLLALVEPGEKVVHPVTGKVLGTLTVVKGYLEVTRVDSGYSYARPLSGMKPEKGMKVRRFEGVNAEFVDPGGSAEALYRQLRQQLPQLNWRDYDAHAGARLKENDDRPTIIFKTEGRKLEGRTAAGTLLHSYLLATAAPSLPSLPATPAAVPSVPTPQQTIFPDGHGKLPAGIVRAGQSARNKEFWHSPMQSGQPTAMAIGHFSPGAKLQIAVAQAGELRIYPLADLKLGTPIAVSVPKSVTPLRLAAADLDHDGIEELYVTGKRDGSVMSYVVKGGAEGFRVVKDEIPWFFRSLPLPSGKRLVAQRSGGELRVFEGPVRLVTGTPAAPALGAVVPLPAQQNLYGYLPVTLDGKPMGAGLSSNDRLELFDGRGALEWTGDDELGGSEDVIIQHKNSEEVGDYHYLPAPLLQAPGGEVLVPVNNGNRLFRIHSFSSSHVRGMRLQGGELVEQWRTRKQNGYLADMAVADLDGDGRGELVMLVLFEHHTLLSDGKFALVSYQLP